MIGLAVPTYADSDCGESILKIIQDFETHNP